jgi:transposase
MLHAGLDLSRRRLDVCLLSELGEVVDEIVAPPDADGLRYLTGKVARGDGEPVRGVIESMTGARFVHDTLERLGWDVLIADAQKVKGLAPLACKTDRIDARVLAVLSHRDLGRRSGCPTRGYVQSARWRGFGCIWSSTSRCSSTGSTRR